MSGLLSVNLEASPRQTKKEMADIFWRQEADRIRTEFWPNGLKEEKGKTIHGVGFVFEALARYSENLPQNTAAAEAISKELLHLIAKDIFRIRKGRRMPAIPDFIWLVEDAPHITICGVGEAKTNVKLADSHTIYHQLHWHQINIGHLVENLNKRTNDPRWKFRQYRAFHLRNTLQKLLVVPKGTSEEFFPYLQPGWECREVEFSLWEIYELCSMLWPGFRYKSK